MLSILDRYIGKQVLLSISLTLLVLIGLRTLFTLLDEAGKVGEGVYQFADAIYYSLLLIPSRIYEFFPMAVLIGGLSALGNMAAQNELTVMRAAGIKTIGIVASTIKATAILMVLVFVIGEWVSPISSVTAQQERAAAISGNQIKTSAKGVWARSGQDILHIKKVISDHALSGVTLFQMDDKAKIKQMVTAQKVTYRQSFWVYHKPTIRVHQNDKVLQQRPEEFVWDGELKPQHVEVLTVEPEMLDLKGLREYQQYLDSNQLDSRHYQLAFWRKLTQPLSLVVMMVLASSFIFGPMRSVSMGARLMSGIVVGFSFHIVNNFFGPISLVYQFPPFLGALMPVVLFAVLSAYLLKRAR
jgi:lipopolysaccharide export system permease protein